MQTEQIKDLEIVLKKAVYNRELVGGNFLVLEDGEEVCYLEEGMADREKGIPIRRDTIFRLYSITKPVTAAAVMLLLQQGKLELYDPVCNYLNEFLNQRVEENGKLVPVERQMTIKDLLSMTSGLVYPGNQDMAGRETAEIFDEIEKRLQTDHPMTTIELANKLGKATLAFQPGSAWLYGTSADVLGAIIEVVTEMSLGEFLKKNFFEPLEMVDTDFYVPEEKRNRLAAVYMADGKSGLCSYKGNNLGISHTMDAKPAFESGGAGLASTIEDYSHFGQMLLNGGNYKGRQILKPGVIHFMTMGQLDAARQESFEKNCMHIPGNTYGNLVRILKNPGYSYSLGNAGEYGWDGWLGCYFCNDKKARRTILLMMQKTDSGTTPLIRRLRNIIISGEE